MTDDALIEKLIMLFSRTASRNAFLRYAAGDEEFKSELERRVDAEPWFEDIYRCGYCLYRGITCKVLCPVCGREIPARKASAGRVYCSCRCSRNSKSTADKIKSTMLERYGCEHAMMNDVVKSRMMATNTERYGGASPMLNDAVRMKAVETSMRKYGVSHPMKSREYILEHPGSFSDASVRAKAKSTVESRYGCNSTMLVDEFREKSKKTCLERYGCEHASGSAVVKSRILRTVRERYGVDNVFQCVEVKNRIRCRNIDEYGVTANALRPEVIEKRHCTMMERYGAGNPSLSSELREKSLKSRLSSSYDAMMSKWKDYVVPLFSKEDYTGFYGNSYGKTYRWRCVKCGMEFEQHVHVTGGVFYYMPRCLKCFPNEPGYSHKEKGVLEFVKSLYDGEIEVNTRAIISPLELDIYIPDKKVAIEFDGLYWHSGKDKNYHVGKTEECLKKGIRLIVTNFNEKQ